jgi:hypothetical protein
MYEDLMLKVFAMQMTTIANHHDAVTDDHKHSPRSIGDETWTFDHLQAFVVLFSNHCFSREVKAGELVDESLT